MMKKLLALVMVMMALSGCMLSCQSQPGKTEEPPVYWRLADFVGVWADENKDSFYRFNSNWKWFRYNAEGVVEENGEMEFDGSIFTLSASDALVHTLKTFGNNFFSDENGVSYFRTDSPATLYASSEYSEYFQTWFEDGDLMGNRLKLAEDEEWALWDFDNTVLSSGTYCAYADEEDTIYLYWQDDVFYGTLHIAETSLYLTRLNKSTPVLTRFETEENSVVRYAYFRDKKIECNYEAGSGSKLLRNGGAVYNSEKEYKRMSVNASIDLVSDKVEEGERELEVSVRYVFKRSDMPAMRGTIYNAVQFAQYDYYSGRVLYMDTDNGYYEWTVGTEEEPLLIRCEFSSVWEMPESDEMLTVWVGTYRLTMPEEYDGFVIGCKPVYPSYAAQVSSSTTPAEDTLALEDLGEDVKKCLLCRIGKFNGTV